MYEGQTQKERRVLSMSRYFDTFFSDKIVLTYVNLSSLQLSTMCTIST